MPEAPKRPSFPWWIILCLVGLDYFSSISYLPSIAVAHMITLPRISSLQDANLAALAPIAAIGVVLVTFLCALPVYLYVVGKSPHGRGGVGLLERHTEGWGGKAILLVLLGFVAADFILTRTISVSDAAVHIQGNYYFQNNAAWIFRDWLPSILPQVPINERVAISVILAIASFGFYFFLVRQLSQGFLGMTVAIVIAYLVVNSIVLGAGLMHLRSHPDEIIHWRENLRPAIGEVEQVTASYGTLTFLAVLALITFPPMAIGLSGFEMTLATAPLVQGADGDEARALWWRIFYTRVMMVAAAVIMAALVLGSIFVVALLVPRDGLFQNGEVQHRALSYLAHGGETTTKAKISWLFGPDFGTIYDLVTVATLCLAGAAATISLREIVPDFLTRFGMQFDWARQVGVILHLFNAVILVTTVVFKASVTDQQWAYAASVVALLFGVSLAALLDVRASWKDSWLKYILQIPFLLSSLLFLFIGLLIMFFSPAGVLISLGFVVVVMTTAIISRWVRSTEPRFQEFRFASPEDKQKWDDLRRLDFQVIVPHVRNKTTTLNDKEEEIRKSHRIAENTPLLFVEVEVGDPSEFVVQPVLSFEEQDGREVIVIREATSVPHTLAAVGLAFRETGTPPEMYFSWSSGSPLEANLNFVLLGQGNVPWLVHELVRRAEPDPERRPRVMVA